MFHLSRRRLGLTTDIELSTTSFRVPGRGTQDSLFA